MSSASWHPWYILWITFQVMLTWVDPFTEMATTQFSSEPSEFGYNDRTHPTRSSDCRSRWSRYEDAYISRVGLNGKRHSFQERSSPTGRESSIQIRAVLVPCDAFLKSDGTNGDRGSVPSDASDTDERSKWGGIRNCRQKLRITMRFDNIGKVRTEEEFVVIDHVIDTVTMQKIRLDTPYVVKIRQEPILQLYGLKFQSVVNAEASEEVINKNRANYTGCNDGPENPTCGLVQINGQPVRYSQGFCCSCDAEEDNKSDSSRPNESSAIPNSLHGADCRDGANKLCNRLHSQIAYVNIPGSPQASLQDYEQRVHPKTKMVDSLDEVNANHVERGRTTNNALSNVSVSFVLKVPENSKEADRRMSNYVAARRTTPDKSTRVSEYSRGTLSPGLRNASFEKIESNGKIETHIDAFREQTSKKERDELTLEHRKRKNTSDKSDVYPSAKISSDSNYWDTTRATTSTAGSLRSYEGIKNTSYPPKKSNAANDSFSKTSSSSNDNATTTAGFGDRVSALLSEIVASDAAFLSRDDLSRQGRRRMGEERNDSDDTVLISPDRPAVINNNLNEDETHSRRNDTDECPRSGNICTFNASSPDAHSRLPINIKMRDFPGTSSSDASRDRSNGSGDSLITTMTDDGRLTVTKAVVIVERTNRETYHRDRNSVSTRVTMKPTHRMTLHDPASPGTKLTKRKRAKWKMGIDEFGRRSDNGNKHKSIGEEARSLKRTSNGLAKKGKFISADLGVKHLRERAKSVLEAGNNGRLRQRKLGKFAGLEDRFDEQLSRNEFTSVIREDFKAEDRAAGLKSGADNKPSYRRLKRQGKTLAARDRFRGKSDRGTFDGKDIGGGFNSRTVGRGESAREPITAVRALGERFPTDYVYSAGEMDAGERIEQPEWSSTSRKSNEPLSGGSSGRRMTKSVPRRDDRRHAVQVFLNNYPDGRGARARCGTLNNATNDEVEILSTSPFAELYDDSFGKVQSDRRDDVDMDIESKFYEIKNALNESSAASEHYGKEKKHYDEPLQRSNVSLIIIEKERSFGKYIEDSEIPSSERSGINSQLIGGDATNLVIGELDLAVPDRSKNRPGKSVKLESNETVEETTRPISSTRYGEYSPFVEYRDEASNRPTYPSRKLINESLFHPLVRITGKADSSKVSQFFSNGTRSSVPVPGTGSILNDESSSSLSPGDQHERSSNVVSREKGARDESRGCDRAKERFSAGAGKCSADGSVAASRKDQAMNRIGLAPGPPESYRPTVKDRPLDTTERNYSETATDSSTSNGITDEDTASAVTSSWQTTRITDQAFRPVIRTVPPDRPNNVMSIDELTLDEDDEAEETTTDGVETTETTTPVGRRSFERVVPLPKIDPEFESPAGIAHKSKARQRDGADSGGIDGASATRSTNDLPRAASGPVSASRNTAGFGEFERNYADSSRGSVRPSQALFTSRVANFSKSARGGDFHSGRRKRSGWRWRNGASGWIPSAINTRDGARAHISHANSGDERREDNAGEKPERIIARDNYEGCSAVLDFASTSERGAEKNSKAGGGTEERSANGSSFAERYAELARRIEDERKKRPVEVRGMIRSQGLEEEVKHARKRSSYKNVNWKEDEDEDEDELDANARLFESPEKGPEDGNERDPRLATPPARRVDESCTNIFPGSAYDIKLNRGENNFLRSTSVGRLDFPSSSRETFDRDIAEHVTPREPEPASGVNSPSKRLAAFLNGRDSSLETRPVHRRKLKESNGFASSFDSVEDEEARRYKRGDEDARADEGEFGSGRPRRRGDRVKGAAECLERNYESRSRDRDARRGSARRLLSIGSPGRVERSRDRPANEVIGDQSVEPRARKMGIFKGATANERDKGAPNTLPVAGRNYDGLGILGGRKYPFRVRVEARRPSGRDSENSYREGRSVARATFMSHEKSASRSGGIEVDGGSSGADALLNALFDADNDIDIVLKGKVRVQSGVNGRPISFSFGGGSEEAAGGSVNDLRSDADESRDINSGNVDGGPAFGTNLPSMIFNVESVPDDNANTDDGVSLDETKRVQVGPANRLTKVSKRSVMKDSKFRVVNEAENLQKNRLISVEDKAQRGNGEMCFKSVLPEKTARPIKTMKHNRSNDGKLFSKETNTQHSSPTALKSSKFRLSHSNRGGKGFGDSRRFGTVNARTSVSSRETSGTTSYPVIFPDILESSRLDNYIEPSRKSIELENISNSAARDKQTRRIYGAGENITSAKSEIQVADDKKTRDRNVDGCYRTRTTVLRLEVAETTVSVKDTVADEETSARDRLAVENTNEKRRDETETETETVGAFNEAANESDERGTAVMHRSERVTQRVTQRVDGVVPGTQDFVTRSSCAKPDFSADRAETARERSGEDARSSARVKNMLAIMRFMKHLQRNVLNKQHSNSPAGEVEVEVHINKIVGAPDDAPEAARCSPELPAATDKTVITIGGGRGRTCDGRGANSEQNAGGTFSESQEDSAADAARTLALKRSKGRIVSSLPENETKDDSSVRGKFEKDTHTERENLSSLDNAGGVSTHASNSSVSDHAPKLRSQNESYLFYGSERRPSHNNSESGNAVRNGVDAGSKIQQSSDAPRSKEITSELDYPLMSVSVNEPGPSYRDYNVFNRTTPLKSFETTFPISRYVQLSVVSPKVEEKGSDDPSERETGLNEDPRESTAAGRRADEESSKTWAKDRLARDRTSEYRVAGRLGAEKGADRRYKGHDRVVANEPPLRTDEERLIHSLGESRDRKVEENQLEKRDSSPVVESLRSFSSPLRTSQGGSNSPPAPPDDFLNACDRRASEAGDADAEVSNEERASAAMTYPNEGSLSGDENSEKGRETESRKKRRRKKKKRKRKRKKKKKKKKKKNGRRDVWNAEYSGKSSKRRLLFVPEEREIPFDSAVDKDDTMFAGSDARAGYEAKRYIERARFRARSTKGTGVRDARVVNAEMGRRSTGRSKRSTKSNERRQIRGGQECTDGKHPTRVEPAGYLESAHCLRFSDLWYSVYRLEEPVTEHNVYIELYEKRAAPNGSSSWADLTRASAIRIGSLDRRYENPEGTLSLVYSEVKSSREQLSRLLDPARDRLLIPSSIGEQRHATQEGAGEYLVVEASAISEDGGQCDKAGVGFEAFARQPNRCGRVTGTCLKNQPLAYWRHDMEARAAGRPGCYFLSNFAPAPRHPVERNASGSGSRSREFLGLEYDSPHVSAIDIEVAADYNAVEGAGPSGRITEVRVDGTQAERTIVTIVITNTGSSSAWYQSRIADCPADLPASWASAERPIPTVPAGSDRSVTLDLHGPLPLDEFHCSAQLVNRHGDPVATRRIEIRKGDRCHCVWHCLCACVGSATGQTCLPMSPEHYRTAGFQGPVPIARLEASPLLAAGKDVLLFAAALLLLLLLMGIVKWLMGTCVPEVSRWGLDDMVGGGRSGERFEDDPKCKCVASDESDDLVRANADRICGRKLEFLLNLTFFLTYPVLVCCRCARRAFRSSDSWCDSTTDRSKTSLASASGELPRLICVNTYGDYGDSRMEAEDTEYVLNELRRSRETLQQRRDGCKTGHGRAGDSRDSRS